MQSVDEQYRSLLRSLLHGGERIDTRNAPVRRLFGLRCVLGSPSPVTLRRTAWRKALREMEWFLSGSNNTNDLHEDVRDWWAPWANKGGTVRANYGQQLRHYADRTADGFDQVGFLLEGIKDHPNSRRNLITTWHSADMANESTPITNCHLTTFQTFIDANKLLHAVTYQRSADVVCGLPHNWIQAQALLMWLADSTGHGMGSLIWMGGDVHLYEEHVSLAEKIVAADGQADVPVLQHDPKGPDFRADDFTLSRPYVPSVEERARMII